MKGERTLTTLSRYLALRTRSEAGLTGLWVSRLPRPYTGCRGLGLRVYVLGRRVFAALRGTAEKIAAMGMHRVVCCLLSSGYVSLNPNLNPKP